MIRRIRAHLGLGALLLAVLAVVQYWPVIP